MLIERLPPILQLTHRRLLGQRVVVRQRQRLRQPPSPFLLVGHLEEVQERLQCKRGTQAGTFNDYRTIRNIVYGVALHDSTLKWWLMSIATIGHLQLIFVSNPKGANSKVSFPYSQPTLVRPFDSSPAGSEYLSSPSSVRHVDMVTRHQGISQCTEI